MRLPWTITAADARLQNLPEVRLPLDSQVYFLQGSWKEWGYLGWKLWTSTEPPGRPGAPNVVGGGQQGGGVVSVLVHNKQTVPARPQWKRDVAPLLTLYANLYPAMFAAMDLTDESLVRTFARQIHAVMVLPFDHPGFMPLTRDLSKRNQLLICRWLSQAHQEATGEILPEPGLM